MAKFQIDLLDVGAIEYGDSVLVQAGGLTALIDGGKSASGKATSAVVLGETVNHLPLDQQVKNILGTTEVDLLVVTHCHSDHIGCLPQLFAAGRLQCKHALVADAQYGYGIAGHSDMLPDFAAMEPRHKLRLALREEPINSTDPREIWAFIEDSASEFSAYVGFVKGLKDSLGGRCVEYRGLDEEESPGLQALLTAMAPMGLKIYGPTPTQLLRCAGFLEGRSQDDEEPVLRALQQSRGDLVEAYRALQPMPTEADFAGDSEGENGNAVNNQSLVMSVSDGTQRVLLTGDMQFVKPQLADDELKTEMKLLMAAVLADAPFAFVKISHHGATNGQDVSFLRKLGASLFGISTGSRSLKHPTKPTLDALQTLATEKGAKWVRVDINGRCGFSGGTLQFSRNAMNDTTPAAQRAGDEAVAAPPALASAPVSAPAALVTQQAVGDDVEVVVRIPRGVAKVSLTIEVTPGPLA